MLPDIFVHSFVFKDNSKTNLLKRDYFNLRVFISLSNNKDSAIKEIATKMAMENESTVSNLMFIEMVDYKCDKIPNEIIEKLSNKLSNSWYLMWLAIKTPAVNTIPIIKLTKRLLKIMLINLFMIWNSLKIAILKPTVRER